MYIVTVYAMLLQLLLFNQDGRFVYNNQLVRCKEEPNNAQVG